MYSSRDAIWLNSKSYPHRLSNVRVSRATRCHPLKAVVAMVTAEEHRAFLLSVELVLRVAAVSFAFDLMDLSFGPWRNLDGRRRAMPAGRHSRWRWYKQPHDPKESVRMMSG